MAKNEFLPFGTAANANVLPNADYQALPARSAGFNAGVAKSEELNTVWRQASVIASVVAQFIVNKSGMDALDNGDTGGLLDNLELAFSQQAKDALSFTQSLSDNGYQELPSGLIIQWGSGIADSDGKKRVVYDKPFLTKVYQVIVSPTNKYDNNAFVIANVDNTNYQLSYFDMVSYIFDMTTNTGRKDHNGFTWIALGK